MKTSTALTTARTDAHLEKYFHPFRNEIIGLHRAFTSPFGQKRILYADWTASGRLYRPIEEKLTNQFGPFVANTHTETNITGHTMTVAYHKAREIIKKHVNARPDDCLISYGSGMTGVINKFQRILSLRLPERWADRTQVPENERPVVIVTHMEHHSNQTSWLETICDVEVVRPTDDGHVDLEHFEDLLLKYAGKRHIIAAITACSNVTGIQTPYHEMAAMTHRFGGLCFVDFACSAPYVSINMHPENPDERLDAIYFSPHKFLGGPGTSGILIFNADLYHNRVPDNPGGGTVKWTNPWKEHDYIDSIEEREDGGTPPFLQTIKTALCVLLKEQMGSDKILQREEHLLSLIFNELADVEGLRVFENHIQDRLGVVSFTVDNLHYNLGVRLLNDHFGIQVRGGCSCAGTYGHYLLGVDRNMSKVVTSEISKGILLHKPGWIRMSIHPTMTDAEALEICEAVKEIAVGHSLMSREYEYNPKSNDYHHKRVHDLSEKLVNAWFSNLNPSI